MNRWPGLGFPLNLSSDGIFKNLFNFISYDCTEPKSSCSHVFNGKTEQTPANYWLSESDNPYFEVSLKKGFLFPTHGAILSCHDSNCIKSFKILGKEKGHSNFSEICFYQAKSDDEFMSKINSFPCSFNKPLTTVRIVNVGQNSSGSNRIALYVFDFFGFISFGLCSYLQRFHISLFPSFLFLVI